MNDSPSRIPDRQLRWVVLGLLCCSTFLNYFDRQTLSVLKPLIKGDFGLSDSQYSVLIGVFMAGYIVMYPLGGRLVDLYGSRRCMLVFVSVWSLATVLTGFVGGFFSLIMCRAVLGLAEPGNYPAALRTVTWWFEPKLRGVATSAFSAGSAVGAILAPPVIALIAHLYGWRQAFILPGLLGFLWVALWYFLYRDPAVPAAPTGPRSVVVPWGKLLRSRILWALVIGRLISDPVWYFLLFWFPGYVQEQMGLSIGAAGAVGWIPFLVADVGGIGLAALSDRLIKRGADPVRARLRILLASACFAPAALLIPGLSQNLAPTLAIFSLLALVCTTWLFLMAALIADASPPSAVATVHGISGAFGAAGGLIFNLAIGGVVDRFGYGFVFAAAGMLHLAASVVLWVGLRHRRGA